MNIQLREVSQQEISELLLELNTRGYACLPNYIQDDDLLRMQTFVTRALKTSGNEYVHFNGPNPVVGSGLEEVSRAPAFEKLMHDLYEGGTGNKAFNEDFYQVLRCLAGQSGQKNSLIFHYDSYLVTALIPIYIPTRGMAGDLLMYPNARKVRQWYFSNVVDKLFLDNPVTQWLLRHRVDKKYGPVRIKMHPGSIYFFWGYRSIHTNERCDADKVRATALFHYANPHRIVPTAIQEPLATAKV